MNIVVLDLECANPGDLSLGDFTELGHLTTYPRTPADEVVTRARAAQIVLTNKVRLDRPILQALPKLELVSVLATGTNVVDLKAAGERGITVCNVPGYGTASVAQHSIALLLELTQAVGRHSAGVRAGRWSQSQDFCYWDQDLVELDGRTLGIVGYGAIGRRVADIARAFGMRILVSTRSPRPDDGVEHVELGALFERADVVSLHCPLSEETYQLVNQARLATMKPDSYLINTSRGPLIDEAALARALSAGKLAGAAVDVLSSEPPAADNPLLSAPRCIVTPHIAWATRAARQRLLRTSAENIRAYLAGRPVNVVSG